MSIVFCSINTGTRLVPFDGRSDYVPFLRHGIPVGGISTGAEESKTKQEAEMFGGLAGAPYDFCYHQSCDGINNLNVDAWVISTKVTLDFIFCFKC